MNQKKLNEISNHQVFVFCFVFLFFFPLIELVDFILCFKLISYYCTSNLKKSTFNKNITPPPPIFDQKWGRRGGVWFWINSSIFGFRWQKNFLVRIEDITGLPANNWPVIGHFRPQLRFWNSQNKPNFEINTPIFYQKWGGCLILDKFFNFWI